MSENPAARSTPPAYEPRHERVQLWILPADYKIIKANPKNVTLTDMTQAPEILKSMIASIDGDCMSSEHFGHRASNLREYLAHLV